MRSKDDLLSELVEDGARIVFAQHVLSGNRDQRVKDFFAEERYNNLKLNLEATNLELVERNTKLQHKVGELETIKIVLEKRIKFLNDKLVVALKAIEELENIIDNNLKK